MRFCFYEKEKNKTWKRQTADNATWRHDFESMQCRIQTVIRSAMSALIIVLFFISLFHQFYQNIVKFYNFYLKFIISYFFVIFFP